jgi:hypothetical protein
LSTQSLNLSILQSVNHESFNLSVTQSTNQPIKKASALSGHSTQRFSGFACCRAKVRVTQTQTTRGGGQDDSASGMAMKSKESSQGRNDLDHRQCLECGLLLNPDKIKPQALCCPT